nr:MAG TPA: hypothetical protein [Caudoviricetes sp.]DAI25498.1 MAG TPA: hypothetical protein [Caudoviricetes sp.]
MKRKFVLRLPHYLEAVPFWQQLPANIKHG